MIFVKGVSVTEKGGKKPIDETIDQPRELKDGDTKEMNKDETTEDPVEDLKEFPKEQSKEEGEEIEPPNTLRLFNKHKKFIKGIIIGICILIFIYLGMALHYMDHFYFGTKINNMDVSGKTIEGVEEIMEAELLDYSLSLKERWGRLEQINAVDIGLKYSSDKIFMDVKESQNPFKWPGKFFNTEDLKFTIDYQFSENLLRERIEKLTCFNPSMVVQPRNPSFKYLASNFKIIDEVPGNKVDKNILYRSVANAIEKGEKEIDLELVNAYIKPKYHSKSKEVLEAKNILNKYVATKVTYSFGEDKEVLDGSIINEWLKVDEDFKVKIDEEKVKDYVQGLSKTYNTIGSTRSFKTPSGKAIKVSGGDYGWSINKSEEIKELVKDIKSGKTVSREPAYNQKAFSRGKNDIGNTFVEIDLAKQHIWFYKNNKLIVDGPVVTGNVSRNHTTPKGVYRLKYKAKNVILRGPDYASPVTFWMPFNGGIGMHDANWRSVFGGKIYRTNGSHGCINCPYNVAKKIYNNIKPNTPIICH